MGLKGVFSGSYAEDFIHRQQHGGKIQGLRGLVRAMWLLVVGYQCITQSLVTNISILGHMMISVAIVSSYVTLEQGCDDGLVVQLATNNIPTSAMILISEFQLS